MSSKSILIMTILLGVALASVGTFVYRGAWADEWLAKTIKDTAQELDFVNPEAFEARVADNWAVIEGKVDREDLEQPACKA